MMWITDFYEEDVDGELVKVEFDYWILSYNYDFSIVSYQSDFLLKNFHFHHYKILLLYHLLNKNKLNRML